MTRALILAAALLGLSTAVLAETPAPGFVPGTEDVPLMPGLATDAGSDLVFDKPQGRIVEIRAHGALTRKAVLAFYKESLKQLGWHETDERHFQREGERLSLDFNGSDGNLQVGFTLAPQ
ncbi:MAG: hypothetical protein WDN69_28160 [Aliidongia sp.]